MKTIDRYRGSALCQNGRFVATRCPTYGTGQRQMLNSITSNCTENKNCPLMDSPNCTGSVWSWNRCHPLANGIRYRVNLGNTLTKISKVAYLRIIQCVVNSMAFFNLQALQLRSTVSKKKFYFFFEILINLITFLDSAWVIYRPKCKQFEG